MNPIPEVVTDIGRSRIPLTAKDLERLKDPEGKLAAELRKDDPGASDVHVDTPSWPSPKKKRKRKLPKSNIRVITRKSAGRRPFANAEREKEFAALMDKHWRLLGQPSAKVIRRAIDRREPEVYIRALEWRSWSRRFAEELEDALVVSAVGEAERRFGDYRVAKDAERVQDTLDAFGVASDVIEAGGKKGAKVIPLRVRGAFDLKDPAIRRWARKESSELVTNISNYARENIRKVIARMYSEGIHPYDAVELVRSALGVRNALFPAWSEAVTNYGVRLQNEGRAMDEVAKLTAAYRDELIDKRSVMIARTEILSAQNEGRLMAWDKAIASGLIDPETAAKRWDATYEGVCDECDALDGEVVSLDDVFSSGDERPPRASELPLRRSVGEALMGGWVFQKHLPGQHDQADHGNRFGGGAGKAAVEQALSTAIAGGGVTMDLGSGDQPSEGYVIAIPGHERVFDSVDDVGLGQIDKYISDHRDSLKIPGAHFGGWVDTQTGQVYLDISIVETDRARAVDLMGEYDQKAVYDLGEGKEIRAEEMSKAAAVKLMGAFLPTDPQAALERLQELAKAAGHPAK